VRACVCVCVILYIYIYIYDTITRYEWFSGPIFMTVSSHTVLVTHSNTYLHVNVTAL